MRRSARLAAAAHHISPDAVTSLPLLLVHRIFLALHVDARGRASCVCRAWRDALADPSLWSRLDMSFVPSNPWHRYYTVFLGAALRRARGQLRHLELSQRVVTWDVLQLVVTANAGSLREVHLSFLQTESNLKFDTLKLPTVEQVVASAPLLQVLTAENLSCTWEDAPQMLRAVPPFASLVLRGSIGVLFAGEDELVGGLERFGPFAAALADAALQPALSGIIVRKADTAQPALMAALADAALARRLRELKLDCCTPPAVAPLARLLAGGSLAVFEVGLPRGDAGTPLFDAAGAALVADVLRINTTLTKLVMFRADLCGDMRVAELLLGALVGHRSLRELQVFEEYPSEEDAPAFGAALAALIAADAPALHVLKCAYNVLGDAGLAPIFEALPLNRHLRMLNAGYNDISEAFARERLLPAVRANATLCELECANSEPGAPAAVEAEELVRRRGRHD